MKIFRQRHSISAAVVVLCACLAGTTAALATTVVAIWRPGRLVLASDSLLLANRKGIESRSLVCKVFREGSVFVAAAGVLAYVSPAKYNVYKEVFNASLGGGDVKAIANRFERITEAPFLQALRAIQKQRPADFAELCPRRECMQVAIAGIRDGKLELSIRGFSVSLWRGVVRVVPSKRYDLDCPEHCSARQPAIVLGAAGIANQVLTSKASPSDLGPVQEAFTLIMMEALSQPRYVGLPVSILELDRNGARWAPGHQGKCR